MPGDRKAALQKAYIEDNPHPTGKKEQLDAADDGTFYNVTQRKYHPWFRQFLRARGYYDIFLFNLDGNLTYYVFKELDYATSLNTGEWKDRDLGNAFRAAADASSPEKVSFFDFKPYGPSYGAPASFISKQIADGTGYRNAGNFQKRAKAPPGAESVAESISTVSEAAKATGEAVSQVDTICTRLSEETEYLKTRVNEFLERIRVA